MKYHIELDLDFKENTFGGLYVAFEGIDGSGKSLQLEKVSEYFAGKGKEVVTTSEPRRTGPIGELIDNILQSQVKVPSESLQYLFTANRIVNQKEIIIPALKASKMVLSHRCFWSAIPYGIMDHTGQAYNIDEANYILLAQSILSMYHRVVIPDVTFYLQVSVDTAMSRLAHMGKEQEMYEKKEKLTKVIEGYNWLLKTFPDKFVVIDAEQESEKVTSDILKNVESRMQHA